MNKKLNILHLEDSSSDAELIKETLAAGGISCEIELVDNRADFTAALSRERFDLILADYTLPAFDGLSALAIASEKDRTAPFLFVSGTVGEERAVESLKRGAADYVVKSNLGRLVPSIRRALQEKEECIARESAEERAVRSISEWQTAFDAIADAVSLLDADGVIKQCNRALTVYLKKPAGQIVGRPHWSVIHGATGPLAACPLTTAKEGLERASADLAVNGKWLNITVDPIIDGSGTASGFVHVMSDITRRKKLEGQLQHVQKMEAIGALAGGVAHDFNNVLNVIIGYGSMVLDAMGADDPSGERMREVLAAADRAAHLTNRLLMFSRKEAVDVKHISVNTIVSGMESMLSRLIGEDIELRIELAAQAATVFADAGQIEQALLNLAANARDAMPKGGRLTISSGSAEIDDDYISSHGYGTAGKYGTITVADTGVGMNAETQSRIFEPFFTTKGVGEGTGLGLSIVYGTVKRHKGFVQVASEAGKGARFTILLPLSDKTADEPLLSDSSGPQGGAETILIAEDEESLRDLARIVLESSGYTVLAAEDGEEAVRMFREHRDSIGLAILDLVMPKKNGTDAADEMKKVRPGIRTLFMSGHSEDVIRKQGATEEGLALIQKPFSSKILLKKVRELLDA